MSIFEDYGAFKEEYFTIIMWQVWANAVDPDHVPYNADNNRGLHCLVHSCFSDAPFS